MSRDTLLKARECHRDVARLLGQHYGDRSVYLNDDGDRRLLDEAISLGLVSKEGQLTPKGYDFWMRNLSA